LSSFPIPNIGGSWTQRVDYFFSKNSDPDFYLISKLKASAIKPYHNQFYFKEYPLLKRFRYRSIFLQIKKIAVQYDKLIIGIYDHVKIAKGLNEFIIENKLEKKIIPVFFQCGFSYEFDNREAESFYNGIDTLALLSNESYTYEKNKYLSYPSNIKILPNPIDYSKIRELNSDEISAIKNKLNIGNQIVYLWLSADRKKKGLDLVLNAWRSIAKNDKNKVLVVIGNKEPRAKQENVIFLGIKPNSEVYTYYSLADVYLFPTLWKEGFGLSLAEASASGCFIIASKQGAVAEVLAQVKNKILIDRVNFEEEWIKAINAAGKIVTESNYTQEFNKSFLSYPEWENEFRNIFNSIVERINN
jgi:glycosyltransferase involved in cell wall biosynthesis